MQLMEVLSLFPRPSIPVAPSYLCPQAHLSGPSATRPRTFSAPSRRLPPPESSEASEPPISTRYQTHLWDHSLSTPFSLFSL